MEISNINTLGIIEMPYGDLGWGTDPTGRRPGIYSDVQLWKKYRELDDYRLCGVYAQAGVPYTVEEVTYEPKEGEAVYLTLTRQLSDRVATQLKAGNALLLTGGYCKDAVAVCGGIQRAIGADKRVGIIYLDAHSDMSTPETTHTGILGGMDLASILGYTMEEWRLAAGLVVPYEPSLVLLSDFREAKADDDGAQPLVEKAAVRWLRTGQFEDPLRWRAAVAELAEQVDALYLHIDADVLNHRYVPNAACVAQGGPSIHTVIDNIRVVMETGKVLVYGTYGFYFDTQVPGQDSLTLSGLRVVAAGLSSWKRTPSL